RLSSSSRCIYPAPAPPHSLSLHDALPILPPLLALGLLALGQIVFHGTASAYDTRLELQLLLAYAVLLFLASQAFRTAEDWRGFLDRQSTRLNSSHGSISYAVFCLQQTNSE